MKSLLCKLSALALAIAGAQSALAADADLAAAGYDEDAATQITIFGSGATAQDPGFERFWTLNEANQGLCEDGTLFIFRQDPDANGDIPNRLFFCQQANTNPAQYYAVFKGSTGGSGNGVAPLVRPTVVVQLWQVSDNGASMTCAAEQDVVATATTAAHTIKT